MASDQTDWLDSQKSVTSVETLIQEKSLQWQRNLERLSAYRAFLEEAKYDHLLLDKDRLIYAYIREFHGIKVGIAGFNSAWTCCREEEKSRLWLGGRWQSDNMLRQLEEAQFSIALIHHPVNWFRGEEDPQVFRDIERDFAFCLHGHEHQGWVTPLSDGHTRIAAAACYDRSDRENGYNFVRLDLDTSKGQVWLRRYERTGAGWTPRLIHKKTNDEGIWPLDVLKLSAVGPEPSKKVNKRLLLAELLRSDPELLDLFRDEFLYKIKLRANELMRSARPEEAISYYEKATQLGSNEFSTWANLGALYLQVDRYEDSIEANKKAIEINPSDFLPRFNLALSSLYAERTPEEMIALLEAVEFSAKGTEKDPMNIGRLHLYKGHMLRKLNRDSDALIEYDLAVSQLSQTARGVRFLGESYKSLGDIQARLGDKPKALEHYNKALEPYSLPAFEVRLREVLNAIDDLGDNSEPST